MKEKPIFLSVFIRIILLPGLILFFFICTTTAKIQKQYDVIVDGKTNCLLLDNALRLDAGPGRHSLTTIPGPLPYCIRGNKRIPYAFVRYWDHGGAKVGYGLLLFGKSKTRTEYSSMRIRMGNLSMARGMRIHVFFVDDHVQDNYGGIHFSFNDGGKFYVDSVVNTLLLKDAKRLKLSGGTWEVFCVTGPGYEGIRLSGPNSSPRSTVLLRAYRPDYKYFDYYAVVTEKGLRDSTQSHYVTLDVSYKGAVVYLFCVDDYIKDNSGAVKVLFQKNR